MKFFLSPIFLFIRQLEKIAPYKLALQGQAKRSGVNAGQFLLSSISKSPVSEGLIRGLLVHLSSAGLKGKPAVSEKSGAFFILREQSRLILIVFRSNNHPYLQKAIADYSNCRLFNHKLD
jgi:hypothetical protein